MSGMYPEPYHQPSQTLTMHVQPSTIETMISNPYTCLTITAAYANSSAYNQTLAPFQALGPKLSAAHNLTGPSAAYIPGTASATYCRGLGPKGNLTGADIQSAMIYGTFAYRNLYRASLQNCSHGARPSRRRREPRHEECRHNDTPILSERCRGRAWSEKSISIFRVTDPHEDKRGHNQCAHWEYEAAATISPGQAQ